MAMNRKPSINGLDGFIQRAKDQEPPEQSKSKEIKTEPLIQRSFYLTEKHIKAVGLKAVYSNMDKSEVIRKLIEGMEEYQKV
jgi:hypothetical protein